MQFFATLVKNKIVLKPVAMKKAAVKTRIPVPTTIVTTSYHGNMTNKRIQQLLPGGGDGQTKL